MSDAPQVAVVGAGSWGTAVAGLVSNNADTVLWVRRRDLADTIAERHENPTISQSRSRRCAPRRTSGRRAPARMSWCSACRRMACGRC
jgi:3-hydroxyacyl-CoA dehydrogenase